MSNILNLYTDASVRGDILASGTSTSHRRKRRSRLGPSMIAWIGWHDSAPELPPTIAGQAFVGRQGTQRAEMQAAIHGLHAACSYAACSTPRPDIVALHVDNQTVAKLLRGEWTPNQLKPQYDAARRAIDALDKIGVRVEVSEVSEKHPTHRKAHTMSQNAWNQVLIEVHWRPN